MGDDPNRAGQLAALDRHRGRELAAAPADRPRRPLPDPPARRRTTDVEETLSALTDLVRSGQGARDRVVDLPRLGDRRGAVGRRAAGPRALPHRAAAVLDRQPRHRARGAAGRASATAWARWCGARSRWGCSPAATARARRPTAPRMKLRARPPDPRAQARRRRGAHPARREGRDLADPPGDGVRRGPPGGDLGDHRAAHDGAPRRPARGRGGHPRRRGPRPHRRDRPAGHRRRPGRRVLRAAGHRGGPRCADVPSTERSAA